jgi:hypothetical protein
VYRADVDYRQEVWAEKYGREPYDLYTYATGGMGLDLAQAVCPAVCRPANVRRTAGGMGLDALKLYAQQDAKGQADARSTLMPSSRSTRSSTSVVRGICLSLRPHTLVP